MTGSRPTRGQSRSDDDDEVDIDTFSSSSTSNVRNTHSSSSEDNADSKREEYNENNNEWFDTPNCLTPFRKMALCGKLKKIDIRFGKGTAISVEQIQCLRPIYNQLLFLQFHNLTLTHSQLNALLLEIKKIPHLQNKQVFENCTILF